MTARNAVLNALRRENERARQRGGRAKKATLPVPAGGWNTRDAVPAVPASEATTYTNINSAHDGVRPRKNPVVWASISSTLEPKTLMVHRGASADTFFAGVQSKIWDITSGGFVDTPTSVTGLVDAIFSWINVNGRLVCANGGDAPISYDGANWSTEPLSVAAGQPALSIDKLAGLFGFKNRVYWWQPNQLGFWYSTLDTIGDGLKFFDLSYVTRKGGDLLTMTRYTVDGGAGPDDYPVFVTNKGEAIIYQGSNPNDANLWELVGVYNLGKPPAQAAIPQRYEIAAGWGAQTWLITDQDYVALPQALMTEGIIKPSLLSGAIRTEMATNDDKTGWQALLYPEGPYLIFNVPQGSETYIQHVVNLHTGAPAKWTGMNARSWGVFDGDLYYGERNQDTPRTNCKIYKALATATPVSIEMISGPSRLRSGSKGFTGYRLWASISANAAYIPSTASATMELRTNYTDSRNNTAEILRYNEWVIAGGVGTYVQIDIKGPVSPDACYKHIDYLWEDIDPLTGYRDVGV